MDYTIDANKKPLGRVASEIAVILQGKKSPNYEPRNVGSDRVLVKNCEGIVVTGQKTKEKIYYHHTGYMGHLREKSFKQIFEVRPEEVLYRAVYHMLPKNRLRKGRLKRLIIEK